MVLTTMKYVMAMTYRLGEAPMRRVKVPLSKSVYLLGGEVGWNRVAY